MPSPNESLIWESPPRAFAVELPENMLRCPGEVAPKKVSEPKLVASLARTVLATYARSVRSGPVVCPNADKSLVRSLLRDLPLVTFLSSDWSSFMKWLTKITTVQVATVVGRFSFDHDADLERFSEGLIRFDPRWQTIALLESLKQLKACENKRPLSVLGEERPGKLVHIEPQTQALKFMTRKWQQLLARESDIKSKTLQTDSGWGAGSVIVEPEGDRKIACCEFDISGRELHLAAATTWLRHIREWTESTCGVPSESIRNITISTPYPVIAGYLIEALNPDGELEIKTPDFNWGWHPLLTLLEFLGGKHQPSMLINLHHGSGLQIALVW